MPGAPKGGPSASALGLRLLQWFNVVLAGCLVMFDGLGRVF